MAKTTQGEIEIQSFDCHLGGKSHRVLTALIGCGAISRSAMAANARGFLLLSIEQSAFALDFGVACGRAPMVAYTFAMSRRVVAS